MILYELLTGLRPIDAKRLKKAALTEMIRIIQEEEPSKPSTRLSTDESLPSMAALRQTEPRKLMALLRGELDWVVMKCLEKRRERRYETANAPGPRHPAVPGRRGGGGPTAERRLSPQQVPAAGNRGQCSRRTVVVLALLAGLVGGDAVEPAPRARANASARRMPTKTRMPEPRPGTL